MNAQGQRPPHVPRHAGSTVSLSSDELQPSMPGGPPITGCLDRLAALINRNEEAGRHQTAILHKLKGDGYEPPITQKWDSGAGLDKLLDELEAQVAQRENDNERLAIYL